MNDTTRRKARTVADRSALPPEPDPEDFGLSERQQEEMRARLRGGRGPHIKERAFLEKLVEYDHAHFPMCHTTPVRRLLLRGRSGTVELHLGDYDRALIR